MEGEDTSKHLVEEIEKDFDECVNLYRHLHQHPQIGLEEHNTSKFIRNYIEAQEGAQLDPPLTDAPTAVIARVTSSQATTTVLFRCELDALSFKEESGLPFASNNHLHHACGHDGHMASLLIALKHAARHREHLKRNIVFCFQPGEEGKAGASMLFKAKPDLLEGVSECYAIHFFNNVPPGSIALCKGPVTALSTRLFINIKGKSVHCMAPNAGVDANLIGCTLVTQIYTLISIKVPPLQGATLTVYNIAGGSTAAKVSDNFQLSASLRVTSMDSYYAIRQAITKLTEGLCTAHGAQSSIQFSDINYRPVINEDGLTDSTRKKLENGIDGIVIVDGQKSFAGQDFCEFSQRRPSCFMAVGSAPADSIDPLTKESKFPLHSPFHKIDENTFKTSTKVWATLMFI